MVTNEASWCTVIHAEYTRRLETRSHVVPCARFWPTRGSNKIGISSCQDKLRPLTIAPFGVAYEKIGTIQRRLAWPLHKDDTLFQSGRPTGLNIYFSFSNVKLDEDQEPRYVFSISMFRTSLPYFFTLQAFYNVN